MNTAIEVILSRRSTRLFESIEISDKAVNSILECARWAPSGLNQQPWRFVVIRNKKNIEAFVAVIENCFRSYRDSFPQKKTVLKRLDNYRKYISITSASMLICVLGKPYESYLAKLAKDSGVSVGMRQQNVDSGQLSIGGAIQNILIAVESLGLGACWMTGPLIFQKDLEQFLGVRQPWNLVSIVPIGGKQIFFKRKRTRLPLEEVCVFWD